MTNEIRQKRTLNSKHFQQENGKINGQFHAGHVHYFNKLGIGDSQNDYRSIDWTLSFDEIKRGWFFNYHSFHPFLPEYADEWVEFRDLFDDKDQTIKYKAHASHVKGRLVMPEDIGLKESSVNCVIYDDAFGEGKDYILYFTRSALKKVVRIREAFKGTEEQRFTWDIDFPKENDVTKKVKRAKDKDKYELDVTKDKTFDSDRITKIGNDKGDGKEWHTYLRPFMAWDSGNGIEQKYQIVNVEYKALDKTITKIIPASFLTESFGDVFSDTTTSYYSTAYDAYYYGLWNATFSTVRGGTTGDATYSGYTETTSSTDIAAGVRRLTALGYNLGRSGFVFDYNISGVINDIVLKLYVESKRDNFSSDYSYISAVEYTPASFTSFTRDDYNNFGFVSLSDTPDVTDISTSAYLDLTLNSTGIEKMTSDGTNRTVGYGIMSGYDLENQAPPTSDGFSSIQVYFSERTSTSEDPYLSVTYGTRADTIRRFRTHRRN